MSELNKCPACGAPIEANYTGSQCQSCGTALPVRTSSAPASQGSKFNNSAEVMDEVKKLAGSGDLEAAAQVAGAEFGLNQADAQETVEQVKFNLDEAIHEDSSRKPEPLYTSSNPQVIDAPGYEKPAEPSKTRSWIIRGSLGAAVFLCLCCCLPLLFIFVRMQSGQ